MNTLSHTQSTTRQWSRKIAITVASTLVMASGLLSTGLASAAPAFVGAVHLSQTVVTPGGAQIDVTATPSVDATCSVSVSPSIPLLPATTSCDANWPIQFAIHIPGNTTTQPIVYKIKVAACMSSICSESAAVTLTQWAFRVTFTASPLLATPIVAASCPTVSLCLAIDNLGAVYVVAAGKTGTKTQGDFNLSNRRMQTVACGSATYCIGANLDGDVFKWSGGTKVVVTGGHSQMKSASSVDAACSSATVCLVDWSGAQGSGGGGGGGGGWFGGSGGSLAGAKNVIFNDHSKASTSFSTPGVSTGFSCPRLTTSSLSTCAVVDDQGYASVFNNAQWIARSLTSGTLLSVSCASSISCVASDSNKSVINFGAYQLMKAKERANQMTVVVPSLQCAAAYLCFMATKNGIQLAQWPEFDASTGLQQASHFFTMPTLINPVLLVSSPGVSSGFNAFSSKHHYIGSVTIVK